MKRYPNAQSLMVSLMLLLGLFTLLFLGITQWQGRTRLTQHHYHTMLRDKLHLFDDLKRDPQQICQTQRTQTISYTYQTRHYRLHCRFQSLFLSAKPTKEKWIITDNIGQYLDLETYADRIYSIRSLAELPESSEQQPKIVRVLNPIDERLNRDFYGIILTDYPFNFTDKKIYGTIYTRQTNPIQRRNHRFKRQVIENLEAQYSAWHSLPFSKHTFAYDETH